MTRPVTVAELYDDEMSDAYHVGQIDARNRRPRRIDLADTTPLAIAYHHGYNSRQPRMMQSIWPKKVGEDTVALGDLPDPTVDPDDCHEVDR